MFLKIRKKLGILLLACLLILVTIPLAFSGVGGMVDLNLTKIYDNPDNNWIKKCLNDSAKVSLDIKSIVTPIQNNDWQSLSMCADNITADSQAAIDTSNSYNVSSYLQSVKDEYNLAMEQAGQVAIYIKKMVEEDKKGNKEGAKSNDEKGAEYIASYNQHMESVYAQVEIIITGQHAANMAIIRGMDDNHEYIYYPRYY